MLIDNDYIFLTPVNREPRTPRHLITRENVTDEVISALFENLEGDVHIDLETTGLEWCVLL